jgi:hypothetical protein
VFVKPAAELHVPAHQWIAGQIILHDVTEGGDGREGHQQKESLRLQLGLASA